MTQLDELIQRDERGVITAMFAVLAVFFVLIIGVVAEGGRKLNNLSRAEDIAAESARAAAATLDFDTIASGTPTIDQERARTHAAALVEEVRDASIVSMEFEPGSVTVVVRVTGTSYIPGFDLDGVGSHRALALDPFTP